MRLTSHAMSWIALILLAIPWSAEALQKEVVAIGGAEITVSREVLKNGLTVLIMENHTAPTIGFCTAFKVGSVDEWDGVSGVSHILEHMLFKGTESIGTIDWEEERFLQARIEEVRLQIQAEQSVRFHRDEEKIAKLTEEWMQLREAAKELANGREFGTILTENGARGLNAFTSYDATAYIVSLPANRLELWTILESDRYTKPVLREFYTEVENVREERRRSVEDSPGALLYERLTAAAFDAHRYGVEIIGWDSEIRTINRSEVEDYYRRYYAPNQMIIAISGDVDPEKTVAMIDAYFGDYKRQPPPHPVQTEEPEQLGEKRLEVEYDAEPRILMAWHKPTVGHPDNAALTVARNILDNGLSSRFERNIVNKGIAASISASVDNPGERYPNLFTVSAAVQSPHTVADVERAILFEMDRLKTEPVTAAELEKAKTQIETAYVRSFGSNMRSAINIAYEEAVLGNWKRRPEEILACREVTAEDVQRVAKTYFTKKTRTVGYTVKPEKEELESAMGGTR